MEACTQGANSTVSFVQEVFEQQRIAFGYYLRPEAAPEERVYQELPSTAAQLTPLLSTYLDAYNNHFNTNLELGMSSTRLFLLHMVVLG